MAFLTLLIEHLAYVSGGKNEYYMCLTDKKESIFMLNENVLEKLGKLLALNQSNVRCDAKCIVCNSRALSSFAVRYVCGAQ